MPKQANQSPPASPESNELFHLIVENIKDYAIFMTDVDGRLISWNPGVESLLGYTESEILGQPISIIFTPEDVAAGAHLREMETAAREGRVEDKRWHERRDGSRFWANGMVMPLKNQDDTLRGFAKVMRDETAQKLAEEKLEESNHRANNIFESMTDAFVALDHDWRFVHVNHNFESITNREREELIGKLFWEEIPESLGSTFEENYRRAVREQVVVTFEEYYPPLDLWVEVRAYPTPDGLAIYFQDITERKQSEIALRESEEKFRDLANSISQLAWMADASGYISWYNNRWFDYTGTTLEEMQGWGWQAVHHPEEVERVTQKFKRHIASGEIWEDTFPLRSRTGEYRWFLSRALPIRNQEGEIERWFGTNTDVEDLRQAQERLRQSEERFHALLSQATAGITQMDQTGKYLFVNDRFCEIIGYSREELLEMRMQDISDPEVLPRNVELYNRLWRDGTAFVIEKFYLRKDGSRVWVNNSVAPVIGTDGKPESVVCVTLDITARKQSEEALRESEARFRNMADSAPVMVWITEPDGYCSYLSKSWYEFTGQTPETGLGFGWVNATHPEDQQLAHDTFVRATERQEPFYVEYRLRRKDGTYAWAIDSAVQRFSEAGEFLGFIGSVIDISDRKRAEEERERLLESEQAARRQAEEANRLKDEFLATLSHELRTPLNAILGWSQMLQTRNLDPDEAGRALSTIERNARSQNQLIDDLLDVSRIITGKLRLDVRGVDLSNVIAAAVDAARPAAEAKNVRLQALLDPQAGPISGDPDRLQQVIWNLLSNAVKFTPRNGRVQVRLERVNSHVEIVVSDTGKGIEAEFLPHVFDRFRQSDGSMTRRHGGLGLGLAIVRQIIELHGGTVSVASGGAEQGATFTVHVPLLPVRREPTGDVPRVHPAAATGAGLDCPPELESLRVLLVDDEADSRELLNMVLNSCGALVTTANSAAEAYESVKREKFDVIVSDIGMPEEDGFSLIGKIRELPTEQGGAVPAIALTAYARAEDRVRALRSGFQMHMPKPVESTELIVAVANLAGHLRNSHENQNARKSQAEKP